MISETCAHLYMICYAIKYHLIYYELNIIYIFSLIVRFPIGFDFLFITYFLHFFLSWTSSLSISSSAISASTLYHHVLVGLPTGLLVSTLYSILFFTQSSSLFLISRPYYLSLPLLMRVVIGSTPTNSLNSSLVILSFMETPHIHLIICFIFVFRKYTHYVCWWRLAFPAGGLSYACQYQSNIRREVNC